MKTHNKGFIKFVIILVVGLLLLSYFQIDLRRLWNSDLTQGNLNTVWSLLERFWSFIQNVWYNYIKTPIIYILHWVLSLIQ